MPRLRPDGLGWEDTALKTVGEVCLMDPAAALQWNRTVLRLSPRYGRWHPHGIFKFRSWEQINEWDRQIKTNLPSDR